MAAGGYSNLEVYKMSFNAAVRLHHLSLSLPRYEAYETGSQLRRAAKSIPANIAEGYGRRRYTQDFIRFLTYALASCDEVRVHLDILHATGNLSDEVHKEFSELYDHLGRSLNRFLSAVSTGHQEPYRD
jgi:four helix bundle protein